MKGPTNHRLWPFGPRIMVLAVPSILLGLLIVVAITHGVAGWPDNETAKFVLLGILLFSLLPVILGLVDLIVERGAVLEFHGAKLDFSHVDAPRQPLSRCRSTSACQAAPLRTARPMRFWMRCVKRRPRKSLLSISRAATPGGRRDYWY